MPFTTTQPSAPTRIYLNHPDSTVNTQEIKQKIADLAIKGGITERDERLFMYLRDLNVLSLDQIKRLEWADAQRRTAYQRLYLLIKHRLLNGVRVPRSGMETWGLSVGKVYSLGVGGRLWLKEEVNNEFVSRYLKRDQVLHDLLVSEICVRLIEATRRRRVDTWKVAWAGERAASFYEGSNEGPTVAPDSLAVVRNQRGSKTASLPFFIEVDASREAYGRLSSDWGRKVVGYDRFRGTDDRWKSHPELVSLPTFPIVAVVTHGDQRLLNLAKAISDHRRHQVVYYLALWEDLMAPEDILTAPAWLIVTPDGQIVGEDREQRQPLLGK